MFRKGDITRCLVPLQPGTPKCFTQKDLLLFDTSPWRTLMGF